MRVGMGYDVHRLAEDRKMILGGVEIPYEKGLLGHSDADVLVHAIMDALLGAAALGDIGKHFPNASVPKQYLAAPAYILDCDILFSLQQRQYILTESFYPPAGSDMDSTEALNKFSHPLPQRKFDFLPL